MGAHGTHGEPYQEPGKAKWEIKGSGAKTLKQPVTLELWQQHVAGTRPLGIVLVNEKGLCSCASIDVDVYDKGDQLDVIEPAVQRGLVPCRSKSGGLHLFLFLKDAQPAAAVQAVLRDLAQQLGVPNAEIFPKQTQIVEERGDFGNWIVMPYFGSTYGDRLKWQHGLKADGTDMLLPEFLDVAEAASMDTAAFVQLGTSKKKTKAAPAAADDGLPFPGAPCLRRVALAKVQSPKRNEALFLMGIYARKHRGDCWDTKVEEYNSTFMDPPLGAGEVVGIKKSLEKKNYSYTKHRDEIECDADECEVHGGRGLFPTIVRRIKITTKPPRWTYVLDSGVEVTDLSTDQVRNNEQFNKQCLERYSLDFMRMSQDTWIKHCAAVPIEEQQPTDDTGDEATFVEHVVEFLTNRQRGETRDDIFSGRPWQDEEADPSVHWFRLQDLMKFLAREDFRDERGRVGRTLVARLLRSEMRGDSGFLWIGTEKTRAWYVPDSSIAGVTGKGTPRSERNHLRSVI